MNTTKDYYWDSETIEYFADMIEENGTPNTFRHIINFVKNDCQLEDGDTIEDLCLNLLSQAKLASLDH